MPDILDNREPTPGRPSPAAGQVTEIMDGPVRQLPHRVYVKVDMEGLTGVVSPNQLHPESAEFEFARRMLMHDLKAVLEGIFSVGCAEAVVYDAHLHGRNVDLEALDSRVVVISGKPVRQSRFFYRVSDAPSALFLVGYHARAGTPEALLPHTYDDDIVAMRVNSKELGEVGMEAALAGAFGVPLAFVSGDSAAAREARELLGQDVETVEVKRAIGPASGVCLPAARTAGLLRDGAARAVRRAPYVPALVFQAPTRLEVVFNTPASADALEKAEGIERIGQNSIVIEGRTVLAAYERFLEARRLNGFCGSQHVQPDASSPSASS